MSSFFCRKPRSQFFLKRCKDNCSHLEPLLIFHSSSSSHHKKMKVDEINQIETNCSHICPTINLLLLANNWFLKVELFVLSKPLFLCCKAYLLEAQKFRLENCCFISDNVFIYIDDRISVCDTFISVSSVF